MTMNLKGKEVIVTRPNKTVFRDGDRIIKRTWKSECL